MTQPRFGGRGNLLVEEAPGFALVFVLVWAIAGADSDGVLGGGNLGRKDVPDLPRNAVDSQVIEVGWLEAMVASVTMKKAGDEVAGFQVTDLKVSGLDLDAGEVAVHVRDDIVWDAISCGAWLLRSRVQWLWP